MINCNLKRNKNKKECKINYHKVREARFELILPKRDNSQSKIDYKRFNKYTTKINKIFGGSTTHPVTLGCYYDKKFNRPYCEEGFKITAVRDFDGMYTEPKLKNYSDAQKQAELKRDYKRVKQIAKLAGKEFGQESIMVLQDNIHDADYVKGKKRKRLQKNKLHENLFEKHI